ncbi:MAG TPA: extracellular solute-binding protein [Herbaspirillum sp.]|jgi:iron(III) transport system substrate-binding protein
MNKLLIKISALILIAGGWHISAIGAPSGMDFATYHGADRNELLIAAAQKEGEVSVYQDYPVMTAVEAAFTKKYGIKVKSWRADSESILQRVITEARGGRNEVDVIQNNSPENQALHREKMLQMVNSPYQKELMPEAIPNHKEWVGFTLDVYLGAYNTDKVKKEDLPKSYEDLLDPKWKNKLSIEANDYGWFNALIAAMGEEKGRKLFTNIVKTNGMSFRKGHSLMAALVASGEAQMALSSYYCTIPPLKKKGAPIGMTTLQPLIGQMGTVALLKKAQHPAAAMLFYDFLITEGQQIIVDGGYVATTKKIVSPFDKVPMKIIDPDVALDSQDKWVKTYNDILLSNAK